MTKAEIQHTLERITLLMKEVSPEKRKELKQFRRNLIAFSRRYAA